MLFSSDQFFMQQALVLAKRGYLTVSPNPMVGCLLVKNGRIIGEGWHEYAGGNHAELNALIQAKDWAENSTAYVTLEPCCHVGRTGACTEALIEAKIKKVVVAALDPNKLVSGKGIARLKQAGIEVHTGLMEQEAIQLNTIFNYYHQNNRPYVISKWGMSLDGQLQVHEGDTKQITNMQTQHYVHNLRNRVDAIIVGRQTVIDDNPELTVRITDTRLIKHPVRVVISSTADLPVNAKIFDTTIAPTVLFTSKFANSTVLKVLSKKEVECVMLPVDAVGYLNLQDVLQKLADRNITSVLVEGGRSLHNRFLKQGLVNEVQSIIAPVLISSLAKKEAVEIVDRGFFVEDYYAISQRVVEPE